MIEIQLDDRVIEVQPQMTIKQYQNIKKNPELLNDKSGKLLSLYLGISLNELKNLPVKQVKFVEQYITNQILDNKIKEEINFTFDFKGVKYGLEKQFNQLPWGAWVDLEVFSSDDIESYIHNIMAILYRPIETIHKNGDYKLKNYRSEEIEERSQLFLDLPIQYWFSAASFFFLSVQAYTITIKSSLNTTMRLNKMIMKGWKILPKWIKKRLPLDSILYSHINSPTKTLQK